MNGKKLLGGVLGFVLALFPVLGSCGLGTLLFIRKKYKLLLIPALCILFFIIGMSINTDIERQRTLSKVSLSQTIENKIFSIPFPSDKKLTIEEFSNTVQNILSEDITPGTKPFSDYPYLLEEYQKLIDKYYTIYETEYAKKLSAGASFYVPATEKKEIRAELNSFCLGYARVQHPDSNFFIFSIVSFAMLWLFSIPFSAYIFYNYLFNPETNKFSNIAHYESSINLNDEGTGSIDIDKIISTAELQSPASTTQSLPVKINYISETEIQKQLKMTAIQAKMIVAERETNGNFLDFSDFMKRTSLSERICNQFKEQLDFSLNNQSNKQSGRVLET